MMNTDYKECPRCRGAGTVADADGEPLQCARCLGNGEVLTDAE